MICCAHSAGSSPGGTRRFWSEVRPPRTPGRFSDAVESSVSSRRPLADVSRSAAARARSSVQASIAAYSRVERRTGIPSCHIRAMSRVPQPSGITTSARVMPAFLASRSGCRLNTGVPRRYAFIRPGVIAINPTMMQDTANALASNPARPAPRRSSTSARASRMMYHATALNRNRGP